MNIILVTGAAGWIGRKVCEVLQAKGCFVLAADLKEVEGPWDAFLTLDITRDDFPEAECLSALCGGQTPLAVIHCAGLAHRPVETEAVKQQMFSVNAEGTRRVIRACSTWGISRLVYVSSIAFYDWTAVKGDAVTEEGPVSARTAYAASKLEGEQAVLDSDLEGRVVRLATVFGEGDQANFAKLAKAIRAGRFLIPGRGEARKSVIPVNLAAECLAKVSLQAEVPHRVMNAGLTHAPSLNEICTAFSEICGFPMPKSIPLSLFRLLAFAGNGVAKVKPGFPLTLETLKKLSASTEVDCSRAAELLPELRQSSFLRELEKAAAYYQEV